MKITPEQLAALQLQQKNTTRTASDTGFAEVLTQQMDSETSAQSSMAAASAVPMVGLDQALQTAMLNTTTEQTVMDKMENLLSKWENYSQALGSDQNSLRDGYGLLADIRQSVQDVKDTAAQGASMSPELLSVLDELDILSTTEEIKFNRGDYLN